MVSTQDLTTRATVMLSVLQEQWYRHKKCNWTFYQHYFVFCFVDHGASRHNSCKWPTWCTILFSYMFIPNLYMFRALTGSSSGELIVSIWHLVYVILCRWPSGMQVWLIHYSLCQSDIQSLNFYCLHRTHCVKIKTNNFEVYCLRFDAQY
jgi:hypothetical protein